MTRTEARTWGKKFQKAGWRTVTLHESLDGGDCYVTATNGCFNRREFDSVEGAQELLRNEPQTLAGRIARNAS
jgi:hypothetical protein